MFTPKVIGVAIARYDFSSRDTRELSLQEGDVVKIYTKSGANGWWRGEVNGRVSGNLKVLNGKLWEGGAWFCLPGYHLFLKIPKNPHVGGQHAIILL